MRSSQPREDLRKECARQQVQQGQRCGGGTEPRVPVWQAAGRGVTGEKLEMEGGARSGGGLKSTLDFLQVEWKPLRVLSRFVLLKSLWLLGGE